MARADPAAGLPPARPLVHFTPPSGWMNDPNGLVHADGVWHLCYQHHPHDLSWGPMHWGHATSRDLVTWEHRPIALRPGPLGTAFSGSALVDRTNAAGFGPGTLVAFFTHFVEDAPQTQGIVWSSDGGEHWHEYEHNPVLPAVQGRVDCRDPKVLRVADGDEGHWVMVLAAGDEVVFHRSDDLLAWTFTGSFGAGLGAHEGVWETPDLFLLDVEGTSERRWVLTVSLLAGGPSGGAGTQYFVGDFRHGTFVPDQGPEVRWVDHGADFYAPQSWSDAPDGRRTWLAWLSNWDYGRETPASSWRGQMTLPRDVSLVPGSSGPVLAQWPVPELDRCRTVVTLPDRHSDRGDGPRELGSWAAYDVRVRLEAGSDRATGALTLETHAGAGTPTRVTYDLARGALTVRPSPDGLPEGCRRNVQEVPVPQREGYVELRVVVDTCSVEVFADGGRVVLSNQVFPAAGATGLRVTLHGEVAVAALEVAELAPAERG